MAKGRIAVRWNLDQALLWYATKDMELVEAAAEKPGQKADARLTWWEWQLGQAEPMSEADAEDRRDRRVHEIGDPQPEASDTPSWSALAREFHDLLARNPNVLDRPIEPEWFGFGQFGQGEHGAAVLVREDRNASSAARAIGRGRETLNPLLKTDDLLALVRSDEASSDDPSVSEIDQPQTEVSDCGVADQSAARRTPRGDYASELIQRAFGQAPPAPEQGEQKAIVTQVLNTATKGDLRSLPSRDTILRRLGRRK